jgi:FMN reductase
MGGQSASKRTAGRRPPVIVGLGGTTRPGSTTERALRIALAAAAARGAETILLGAADLELPAYAPESPTRTPAALRLVAALRRADGVVLASPGYHGGVSGLVKNALDYAEDLRADSEPYFEGRSVGCIATAAGWQATATTLVALRSITHALRGWPTPLGVCINTAGPVFDGEGACRDDAITQNLRTLADQTFDFAALTRRRRRLT